MCVAVSYELRRRGRDLQSPLLVLVQSNFEKIHKKTSKSVMVCRWRELGKRKRWGWRENFYRSFFFFLISNYVSIFPI
jgi:hypothetical protein